MKKIIIAFFFVALLAGCTDAGHITCYSGGKVIYDGVSTGKIASGWYFEATGKIASGWYFEEKGTGKLIRVSGDCVITN